MLAALTRIDRHESYFAASKEAPAKVDSFDRGFPTKGVIAGFDHREPTVTPLWSKRNGLKKGLILTGTPCTVRLSVAETK